MKILILVPVWGRPEITKIWSEAVNWFKTGEIEVLTILSNEDEYFTQNLAIILDSGYQYCYYKNDPLGQKLNAGVEFALDFNFDYLMNLGSDDLIHPAILALYKPYMEAKEPFFGLNKVYFYDILKKRLAITVPYVFGAGRMIHRSVLEKIRYKGEFLYSNELRRGLDCNSVEKVKFTLNLDYKQVETNGFPYIVDIKSQHGLNDFDMMQRLHEPADINILKYYPNHLINSL